MASSGQTAWNKYFQGKGDIKTRMKKASSIFDAATSAKLSGTIEAGTEITYLSTKKFDSKAVIQYKVGNKNKIVRVTFDNIAKPGVKASGAASLKPQAFGVKETKYSFAEYTKVVSSTIEERKDISSELKTYLSALFNHYATGKPSKAEVTKIYNKVKDNIPINDINKDFGEVLGPVAILANKLLQSKKISLTKTTAKIYVPERPNEPLMDYGIIQGNKQIVVSAKSGTTTNVVKPPDILMLLKKNSKSEKKWKDKKEYKLLQKLSEESILTGPIKAVSAMYPTMISEKAANSVTKTGYDKAAFSNFINSNTYLSSKKNPTANEIMYECEKLIQAETKNGNLDMNSIFADAIKEEVVYVKFELDSTGVGKWGVIVSDDIKKINSYGRAYLRTKNGYTRASDRMGVQV